MSGFGLDSIRVMTEADVPPAVAFVYEIRNEISGKCYVGSTMRWPDRWREHRRALRIGTHHSVLLQRAWNKYGEDAFVCEVIAPMRQLHAPSDLTETEQAWIRMLRSSEPAFGYNIAPVAGSCLGVKHGPEARANYSAAAKRRPITPETREKMSAARRGKPRSPETIEKVRRALLGRRRSPQATERQRQTMAERKHKATETKRASMRAIAAARPPEYYRALHEGKRRYHAEHTTNRSTQ